MPSLRAAASRVRTNLSGSGFNAAISAAILRLFMAMVAYPAFDPASMTRFGGHVKSRSPLLNSLCATRMSEDRGRSRTRLSIRGIGREIRASFLKQDDKNRMLQMTPFEYVRLAGSSDDFMDGSDHGEILVCMREPFVTAWNRLLSASRARSTFRRTLGGIEQVF